MQKSISKLLYLVIIVLFTSSFSVNRSVTKQQEPKIKQEVTKNQDTVKKSKFIGDLEQEIDSVITYKGKFKPFKKKAHASYYHDKFHGRRTASGRKYDKNKLTAAHKKLPFGTILRVTNEKSGKSVIVEVTDRGPFIKGREIDLSKKAFFTIATSSGSGHINVTIEILQK
jgi:rare lipoprotein A